MKAIQMKTAWFTLLVLTIVSCAKDDDLCDPNDEQSPCYAEVASGDNLLLTEYRLNDVLTAKYVYNDENRVIAMYPYDENGVNDTEILYTYNQKYQLVLTTYNRNGYIFLRDEYTYGDGNQPISLRQFDPGNPDFNPVLSQFTYTKNKTVITGNSGLELTYTFDDNGNLLTNTQTTVDGQLLTTLEWGDFDDKKGATSNHHQFAWIAGRATNNPRSERITSLVTAANIDRTVKYTYNKAGYPIKAEVYDRGTDNLVETREYIYVKAK
ncbi:hypothetical protein [Albibacterium indicum]|uniref:hypothetical protein n=1 Tax=Albibacterium indicum TaxID=2292082 RepID=UPI000E50C754|nr:hypothetical protein [Pedobacter indicus]